jgi:hypothetical protein
MTSAIQFLLLLEQRIVESNFSINVLLLQVNCKVFVLLHGLQMMLFEDLSTNSVLEAVEVSDYLEESLESCGSRHFSTTQKIESSKLERLTFVENFGTVHWTYFLKHL